MIGDRVTETRERLNRIQNEGFGEMQIALDLADLLDENAKLTAALDAVRALHRKSPVYTTLADECEHDVELHGIEMADGELYCTQHTQGYTCSECAELNRDNPDGELPDWPCATIAAITSALGEDQ